MLKEIKKICGEKVEVRVSAKEREKRKHEKYEHGSCRREKL